MAIKRFILPINASGPIQNLRTTSVTQTTIALAWDAYPGATAYQVRQNGTLISTPTGTTYSNSGHTAGTSYTYAVRPVVGGSGVASAEASIVVATAGSGSITYVATHYVAPFASVSGASNDYADLGATSWANAVNSGTPTTLGTAMARASGSNKVQVAPGTYVGQSRDSMSGWSAAFAPLNHGTSAAEPLVFFAQHPAATNYGSTSLYSELRSTITPAVSTPRCGVISSRQGDVAGRNYVIFDGFYINELESRSGPSAGTGNISGGSIGCEFRRFVVDRSDVPDYNTAAGANGYNGNCFWIGNSYNSRAVDCVFTGTSTLSNQNDACVEFYNADTPTIEHCTATNAGHGVFNKTEYPYNSPDLVNVTIRFNKLHTHSGVQTQTARSTLIYHNEIVATAGFGIRWQNTAANTLAEHPDFLCEVQAYNNTIIAPGSNFEGAITFQQSIRMNSASQWRDNLVMVNSTGNGSLVYLYKPLAALAGSLDTLARFNYNVYSDTTSTPRWTDDATYAAFAGVGGWQERAATYGVDAFGRVPEQDSQYATVTFQSGTYKLAANGQAALTASSSGGPVGCYITGNEEIGVRANPVY